MRKEVKIFIPVVGQFTNIGDVLHRRTLLSWLNDVGELNVYVGSAPESFIEGLKLDNTAVLYRSLFSWLWAICWSGYKRTAFVFNPGEIRLVRQRLLREIALFPFQLFVRLKKGVVLRVGIAAMSDSRFKFISLWKFLFLPTNEIYWRTRHSQKVFNRGKVIPDLAFYDLSRSNFDRYCKKYLVVSMRADREIPSDSWFNVVTRYANDNNLNIIVVSQVRMDNSRTIEIAQRLGGNAVTWPDQYSHLEQENVLSELYLHARVAISDRLHVLIAASGKNALPACILTQPSDKVLHHFSVIGLNNVSIVEPEFASEDLYSFLHDKVENADKINRAIVCAKERLEDTRKEIVDKIIGNTSSSL